MTMRTKQTRLESLLEAASSIAVGFLAAMATWHWAVPLLWPHHRSPVGETFGIALLFTAVSIARSYTWRRLFEHEVHVLVHRFVLRLLGR